MIRSLRTSVRLRPRRHTTCHSRISHRYAASEAKPSTSVANPATTTTTTTPSTGPRTLSIPGPAWLWTPLRPLSGPFRAYDRASRDRPYVTQFLSSLVIYFLGDTAGQYIKARGEHPDAPARGFVADYDTGRPLRALCIGGVSSIPSYNWFVYLSGHFNVPAQWPAARVLSLAYKVAVNQALFTPVFNSYFFGMQCLLAGEGGPEHISSDATVWELLAPGERLSAAGARIRETVPTSWYNSMKFWPFVTAFSFTFVPVRQRSVFAGFAAIGWQSYLGIVNQRAVEAEALQ